MEQSADLKEHMLRAYEAIAKGDISSLERHLSRQDGVLVIGTDPQEWWTGHSSIIRVFKAQIDELGGGIPIVAGDLQAYSEGTIGWVADRPKFRLPDDTETPCRVTAVFHKEGDGWKLVQDHLSMGVRNEEVFGKKLPV